MGRTDSSGILGVTRRDKGILNFLWKNYSIRNSLGDKRYRVVADRRMPIESLFH